MKLNSLSLWKRLSLASAFAASGGALAIGAAHASNHYSCYHNCYSNYSSYVGNNSSSHYNNSSFFPLSTPLAGMTPVLEGGYGGASSASTGYSTSAVTTDDCNSSNYHSYCYSDYDNNYNGDYLYPHSDNGNSHHHSGRH
ncbi:hypothetical protein ccbrp13_05990 [Ktedonobacteria bacterium brp13]|nr:hypothetical protein ccbrp13_05990 [Ktedonobacteria bacterium brp13]